MVVEESVPPPIEDITPIVDVQPIVEADPIAETQPFGSPPPSPAAEKKTGESEAELPGLKVDYLFEATGGDTIVSAHGGRLRLQVPYRVVQGKYTFYLEQVGEKQFSGFLVSPTGTRHKVFVDFTAIMDLKEVFDKVMM